jgi:hypothetical protein
VERNVLRRFSLGALILFLGLSNAVLGDCQDTLSKLGKISTWSNKDKNLSLTARDLFPEEFVREVESTLGRFDIRVAHYPNRGFLSIMGTVRNRPCVRVKLYEDPEHPQSMIVDDLNLENPLRREDSANLNPDQSSKGLPPQVFRHVKERLFEIVKAGGFQEIRTHSQQHFAVVQLYKRFVGMEPVDEKSRKTLDYLEGLYSFSRKELPEELRPKDVEEFTRWLGSGGSDPSGITPRRVHILEAFLEEGTVHHSFSLLKNKKGEVIGALFNDNEKAKSNIVFFDYTEKTPKILNWFYIAASHQLELVRKLY